MDYGRAIRTVRASRRMSQKDLALLIDADASYVSLLEAGRRKPSLGMLEAVVRATGVPAYLLVMLASDPEDVRGSAEGEVARLGGELLAALVGARRRKRGRT